MDIMNMKCPPLSKQDINYVIRMVEGIYADAKRQKATILTRLEGVDKTEYLAKVSDVIHVLDDIVAGEGEVTVEEHEGKDTVKVSIYFNEEDQDGEDY